MFESPYQSNRLMEFAFLQLYLLFRKHENEQRPGEETVPAARFEEFMSLDLKPQPKLAVNQR